MGLFVRASTSPTACEAAMRLGSTPASLACRRERRNNAFAMRETEQASFRAKVRAETSRESVAFCSTALARKQSCRHLNSSRGLQRFRRLLSRLLLPWIRLPAKAPGSCSAGQLASWRQGPIPLARGSSSWPQWPLAKRLIQIRTSS